MICFSGFASTNMQTFAIVLENFFHIFSGCRASADEPIEQRLRLCSKSSSSSKKSSVQRSRFRCARRASSRRSTTSSRARHKADRQPDARHSSGRWAKRSGGTSRDKICFQHTRAASASTTTTTIMRTAIGGAEDRCSFRSLATEAQRARRLALLAVGCSALTTLLALLLLPALYGYVQRAQTQMHADVDFCRVRTSNVWRELARTEASDLARLEDG